MRARAKPIRRVHRLRRKSGGKTAAFRKILSQRSNPKEKT
jgi:hypothetical protein